MPTRLHQKCREAGCRNRTDARSGYCADHEHVNTQREVRNAHRRDDEVSRMYSTARWRKFCLHVLNRNPLCQRLQAGQPCRNAATLVHHLISPRVRPDLFLAPENVVALCAQCHPPSEGTPDWVAGVDFSASVIAPPMVV
jgi:5-methylcytosine-specific restriction enzyme A